MGGVAKRKSRRVVGDDVVIEIPKTVSKSLRQLLMKGGQGGLIKEGLTTEWDYFPSEKNDYNSFPSWIYSTQSLFIKDSSKTWKLLFEST